MFMFDGCMANPFQLWYFIQSEIEHDGFMSVQNVRCVAEFLDKNRYRLTGKL